MEIIKESPRIQISGCDIDGVARGKIISSLKAEKSIEGFGSIIFGWDALDLPYNPPLKISNNENGFTDILAKIDLNSLRSGFKTNSMPHFLVDFYNLDGSPLYCCPRNLLKSVIKSLSVIDLHPKCGIEFEFFNFKETQTTLAQKKGVNLTPLTTGMFGYSLTRPQQNSQYFTDIYDECLHYGIEIECLHTETGPGVYEVALSYTDALRLADNAHLFKTVVKQIGIKNGIVPCFMAKPYNDLPGCSGHIHVSLANLIEKNVFTNSTGSGIDSLSKTMIHFLAGVLAAIYAPTVNSYKRLVENFWAPIMASYGVENRTAAIRIIAPPTCPASATRLEVRVCGADVNPYLAISAILASGYYGIVNKLELPFEALENGGCGDRLARNLAEATVRMKEPKSIARAVLGNDFVDHFVATREHEWRLWENSVTDWEVKRYMETI